jgi:hypothetical protein
MAINYVLCLDAASAKHMTWMSYYAYHHVYIRRLLLLMVGNKQLFYGRSPVNMFMNTSTNPVNPAVLNIA